MTKKTAIVACLLAQRPKFGTFKHKFDKWTTTEIVKVEKKLAQARKFTVLAH